MAVSIPCTVDSYDTWKKYKKKYDNDTYYWKCINGGLFGATKDTTGLQVGYTTLTLDVKKGDILLLQIVGKTPCNYPFPLVGGIKLDGDTVIVTEGRSKLRFVSRNTKMIDLVSPYTNYEIDTYIYNNDDPFIVNEPVTQINDTLPHYVAMDDGTVTLSAKNTPLPSDNTSNECPYVFSVYQMRKTLYDENDSYITTPLTHRFSFTNISYRPYSEFTNSTGKPLACSIIIPLTDATSVGANGFQIGFVHNNRYYPRCGVYIRAHDDTMADHTFSPVAQIPSKASPYLDTNNLGYANCSVYNFILSPGGFVRAVLLQITNGALLYGKEIDVPT